MWNRCPVLPNQRTPKYSIWTLQKARLKPDLATNLPPSITTNFQNQSAVPASSIYRKAQAKDQSVLQHKKENENIETSYK